MILENDSGSPFKPDPTFVISKDQALNASGGTIISVVAPFAVTDFQALFRQILSSIVKK